MRVKKKKILKKHSLISSLRSRVVEGKKAGRAKRIKQKNHGQRSEPPPRKAGWLLSKIRGETPHRPDVRRDWCWGKKGGFKIVSFISGLFLGIMILSLVSLFGVEKRYQGKIYPGVKILGVEFGGKDPFAVENFLIKRNFPFENLMIAFEYEDKIATLSGKLINLGFDSKLSAKQAFLIGRTGSLLSQFSIKFQALDSGIELSPLFRWEKELLEETLEDLAEGIDIMPQNALFEFKNGKVFAFKLSKKGRRVNIQNTLGDLETKLALLAKEASFSSELKIPLQVEVVKPTITTTQANNLGIETLLGSGISYFAGSSKERIHNIALSSSKLHGLLIVPTETFSLNAALGEVSPATGYKSSYIIKDGKTVLGDGGGVCQTSTTLFRAALNSGLEILERHSHSYRVSYYEQGGYSPGIDATIFAPSVDLKIKNNTPAYILIQTNINYNSSSLTFEFYGKRDGREAEISPVKIWDQKPPPEDKYIDDPALPKGQVKQIDWKAWGAKTSFSYKVIKDGEVLEEKTFYSNFLPWQAVFLRGTKE